MKLKHLIGIEDLSINEINQILERGRYYKKELEKG